MARHILTLSIYVEFLTYHLFQRCKVNIINRINQNKQNTQNFFEISLNHSWLTDVIITESRKQKIFKFVS